MFLYLIVLLIVMIPLVAIILDSRLGQALAGRLESSRLSSGDDIAGERLAFLESEVDRLSSEVEKLSEESDFLHQLLAERSSASSGEAGRLGPGDAGEAGREDGGSDTGAARARGEGGQAGG